MTCQCGHPRHHHHTGCATVTISGPDSEDHSARTHQNCGCTEYQERP
jgi:hypothetical protein